jgi:hypothetical protein
MALAVAQWLDAAVPEAEDVAVGDDDVVEACDAAGEPVADALTLAGALLVAELLPVAEVLLVAELLVEADDEAVELLELDAEEDGVAVTVVVADKLLLPLAVAVDVSLLDALAVLELESDVELVELPVLVALEVCVATPL